MPATSRRIFRHSTNKSTKKGIQAIKIPEPSSSPLTENSPPILSPRSATSTSSPIHRMSTRSMGRQEKILGTIASLAKAPQEKQDCCKVQDSQQCHAAITPLLDDQEPLAIDTTLNSMPANPMQNKTSASTDKPTPVEQVGVETLKQVHDVNTQQPIPQGPVSRSHPEVMAFQSTSSQLISELSSSSHDIAQDSASQCAAMGLSSAGSDSQCSDSDLSSEPGRYDEVIDYLGKKGYYRTEQTLREEVASSESGLRRPIERRAEDNGPHRFFTAYQLLSHWVDENLEIYRAELKRLLWPIFVHSYLTLVHDYYKSLAESFMNSYSTSFTDEHESDTQSLRTVLLPEHLEANALAKTYRNNKYRITLTNNVYFSLIQFLESKEKEGGSVIRNLITNYMNIVTIDRADAGKDRAFAAMIARLHGEDAMPDEDEGIPGHNPGSANTALNAPQTIPNLRLGALPMDSDMSADVRDQIEEDDALHPPEPGQTSLVDELEQQIKREPSEDGPRRDLVPLPAPLARDVAMEVQRIKENRDRFRIPPRSGGVGPGVSVTMFTFHNTFDSVNCIDFSGDNAYVAVGTSESYIRVWSMEGKSLPSISQAPDALPSASRRLIGHSGPVYAVSFSPAIASDDPMGPSTNCRYLLSCSADKSVRLWSLDTWSCLVAYKGHDHPVWDVTWGPFGHYFLTGSHDHTARLWSTDHIAPLRLFVGHDQDVDCVAFHPNNAYVFTGSNDKTVRMWDVNKGQPVRLFTGHTGNVTCVSCAPSGRTLASADDAGAIILWDLTSGRRLKRMRGHSKGGIWSLSWSIESSLLVSGGADQTVRVWDVVQQTETAGAGNKPGADGAASKPDGAAVTTTSIGPGKRGKAKEVTVTSDQISAFLTKKSPVYKVKFTNMNLVLAGGLYLP